MLTNAQAQRLLNEIAEWKALIASIEPLSLEEVEAIEADYQANPSPLTDAQRTAAQEFVAALLER